MTESIGQQLRKRREARRISLEQAAQTTHIRLRYLQALEADDFSVMPSMVQTRGFLRSYAQLLDLPAESLLAELSGEAAPAIQEAAQPPQEDADAPVSQNNAQSIFDEIGAQLKKQRELLGLTLEDVEQNTFLRLRYLKALESGKLKDLPSPVQGRGMLSNYAVFLGMDSDMLLLRFAEGLQANLADRKAGTISAENQQAGIPKRRQATLQRRFFAPDFLVGLFMAVFLVGFVVWAALRVSEVQSGQEPTFTAPSVAEVLAQVTDTPTPTEQTAGVQGEVPVEEGDSTLETGENGATATLAVLVEEATSTLEPELLEPTPTFPVSESDVIQLYLVARQRAWVRVIVDGEVELEGRVVPGNPYLFTGNERLELLTGNGAALQVFLNRQDLGPLGINGEVVQRVFTISGMQTPTPAVSPTGRPTETPTITLTPEGTPSATPTPLNFAP